MRVRGERFAAFLGSFLGVSKCVRLVLPFVGLIVAALVATGLFLVGNAEGQFGTGSRLAELTPSISSSTAVTQVSPIPVGKVIKTFQRQLGVLKVLACPTGGSGATLDVWFQYSADDGMTWQDYANVHVAQTTNTYLIPVNVLTGAPTSIPTVSDGALAANTIVQGPIGDKLRIKYSTAMGTSTGNWTFQAFVLPD
jgi:hypothetical protein